MAGETKCIAELREMRLPLISLGFEQFERAVLDDEIRRNARINMYMAWFLSLEAFTCCQMNQGEV